MNILIIVLLIVIMIIEISTYSAYGPPISNEEADKYLTKYQPFRKNPYNSGIISPKLLIDGLPHNDFIDRLSNGGYISTTLFSLTSKYYINGLGCVPRWSKSHKKIKKLFKTID